MMVAWLLGDFLTSFSFEGRRCQLPAVAGGWQFIYWLTRNELSVLFWADALLRWSVYFGGHPQYMTSLLLDPPLVSVASSTPLIEIWLPSSGHRPTLDFCATTAMLMSAGWSGLDWTELSPRLVVNGNEIHISSVGTGANVLRLNK